MRKLFKMILYIICGIIVTIVIIATLFLNLNPEFGGELSNSDTDRFSLVDNYTDGKFQNQTPTSLEMSLPEGVGVMIEFVKGVKNDKPNKSIETLTIDSLDIGSDSSRITWLGHSTFLLELDGKNILLDPMFSPIPSPIPLMGTKRYSDTLPIDIANLPFIDIVLISHNHFDHLDYKSIIKLKDKVGKFYTPLGVKSHLLAWGVESSKIIELNWWEESVDSNFTFVCTPSRHFSGRGIFDRYSTLWASWVIKTKSASIYFSGDSGYGPHFKEIGNKYGPFDIALLECGQYDPKWADIHMMPEETVQAAKDVNATLLLPIHWGAFTLSLHSWTDPIERVTKEAQRLGQSITTPQIGEPVYLDSLVYPRSTWWEVYK